MNKDNKKAIETLRNSLNEQKTEKKRVTLSEMIYNDVYEEYDDEPKFEETDNMSDETPSHEPQQENTPIEKELPSERSNDPEIMNILSNIRLAVINGLAKLAKKPDTVEYNTMKKILQIVDKPIESANTDK